MTYEQFTAMLNSIKDEYQPVEDEAFEIFDRVNAAKVIKEKLTELQNKISGLINSINSDPDIDEDTKEEYWREADNLNRQVLKIEGYINNIVYSMERNGSFVHLEAAIDILK